MADLQVLRVDDVDFGKLARLCSRFGVRLRKLPDGAPIDGSFWGEPEAGIVGSTLNVRGDTPVHSLLHELGHIICVSPARRTRLHTDAASDHREEAAVCYLQVLLAGTLSCIGRDRIMRDMDAWGYSFPEGRTASWFAAAGDALSWLVDQRVAAPDGRVTFRLRN